MKSSFLVFNCSRDSITLLYTLSRTDCSSDEIFPNTCEIVLELFFPFINGGEPIPIWYNKNEWIKEREIQFPGSSKFWQLCNFIHNSNWTFANNNPVLPIKNFWDFSQLFNALVPMNLATGILIKSSIFVFE